MLLASEIRLFRAYRGKVFTGKDKGPNNDRIVVDINRIDKTVQYDSDSLPPGVTTLPWIPLQEFLDWAEREVTDAECDLYYASKEETGIWSKNKFVGLDNVPSN